MSAPTSPGPLLSPSQFSDSTVTSTPIQESPSTRTIDFEESLEDRCESESIEAFMSNTCGCKTGPQCSTCSSILTIATFRSENPELSKDELDLVVLAQIRACRSMPSQPNLRVSHHQKSSERSMTNYFVYGVPVCRKTFMYVHCIGHKRLEHLTRTHGNAKRQPKNVTFVKNYARAHAMPMPGRMPNHKDKVMVLPSDVSKVFVYSKYKEACTHNHWSAVGRSLFYQIWQELLPFISISTPSTDLCFTCQQNSLSIQ